MSQNESCDHQWHGCAADKSGMMQSSQHVAESQRKEGLTQRTEAPPSINVISKFWSPPVCAHTSSRDNRAQRVFKGRTHLSTCWQPKSFTLLSTLFKQTVLNWKWMTTLAWAMHSCTLCSQICAYVMHMSLSHTLPDGIFLWSPLCYCGCHGNSWVFDCFWSFFPKCWGLVVFAQMHKAVRVVIQICQF